MKNEVLQKYVSLVKNKEFSLVLDCKTRWNSMFEMIEWYMSKKAHIKDLLDLSIEHNIPTAEILFLNELKCSLEPIKLAVDASCRKDAMLLLRKEFSSFYFF